MMKNYKQDDYVLLVAIILFLGFSLYKVFFASPTVTVKNDGVVDTDLSSRETEIAKTTERLSFIAPTFGFAIILILFILLKHNQ